MTTPSELLGQQYFDDGDYDNGAAISSGTPEEHLRVSAEGYLERAVSFGDVDRSRIFFDNHLGKFVGYTSVETDSGVRITKGSTGYLDVTAEYDEDTPKHSHALEVEIELSADNIAQVHERRQKLVDGNPTGEGGSRTLGHPRKEQVMGEVTKLIWQRF